MPIRTRLQLALNGNDPSFGGLIAVLFYAVIVVSACIITLQSIPAITETWGDVLNAASIAILGVFSVEYVVRVWSAERPLSYAFSFWGLVDILAIAPAALLLWPEAQTLRTLRLLRLFRLLKLLRLRRASDRIMRALQSSRDELILFTCLAAIVLFLASVGIYTLERHAQPEDFGTIPRAMWWALATLTTVGYGDVYPVTAGGKVFTAIILIAGIAIVAIPAGIITSALLAPQDKETKSVDQINKEDQI